MTVRIATGIAVAVPIALALSGGPVPVIAQPAPTILISPAETPGQFTYAFVDVAAADGGWVAIDFHREPECAEATGFNLLEFVDFPHAFACRLTISAKEWWDDTDLAIAGGPWQTPPWLPGFRTPSQALWRGAGRVPIYFVDVVELADAIRDGVLTVHDLKGLPSRQLGYATAYQFVQLNSSRSNSFPTMRDGQTQTVAQGLLQDGRSFRFARTTHGPDVTSVSIVFE